MPRLLAPLRRDLDIFPSDNPAHPGLVIQDRLQLSGRMLVVPTGLAHAVACFDGEQSDLDLRAVLTRITGELEVSELAENLESALSQAGFLDDEHCAQLRADKLAAWRAGTEIRWSHSGPGNYPDDPDEAKNLLSGWLNPAPAHNGGQPVAIAAPHASPGAAARSYSAAYKALRAGLTPDQAREKIFVVLGTSHYGTPDQLGATAKNFVTPLGSSPVHPDLLNQLRSAAGPGLAEEDIYFSLEHSVEFQVLFLQHLYGPDIQILPLLCGSYARSIYKGGLPEDDDNVRRYLDALAELNTQHGSRLVWILGIDMAHIGTRYDDASPAIAQQGFMSEVTTRDQARIASVTSHQPAQFWELVQQNQDDLKWCGSAPIYTFLKACPDTKGTLLDYEHWQIDPESVVTFGAISFTR